MVIIYAQSQERQRTNLTFTRTRNGLDSTILQEKVHHGVYHIVCVCVSCLAGPCELFACSFLGRWAVLSKHIKAIHSISKPTFPVFLLFQGEAPHFLMIIMLQAAHLWNQKLKRTKLEIWSFEHPLRYFCCIFGIAFFLGLRLKTRTTKQQAARRLCCYWRTWSFKPFRAAGPLPLLI